MCCLYLLALHRPSGVLLGAPRPVPVPALSSPLMTVPCAHCGLVVSLEDYPDHCASCDGAPGADRAFQLGTMM
jgi:hypothetical protein